MNIKVKYCDDRISLAHNPRKGGGIQAHLWIPRGPGSGRDVYLRGYVRKKNAYGHQLFPLHKKHLSSFP